MSLERILKMPVRVVVGVSASVKRSPRERLAAGEEEQEEAAPAQAGHDQRHAEPPHGPGAEDGPAVEAAVRREGEEEDGQEPGDGQGDAQAGGHADGLEGAVGDAKADEVAVRAVPEQLVDVIGNGLEAGRVGRVMQVLEGLGAHGGRDVELLLGTGCQVPIDDGAELLAASGIREGESAGGQVLVGGRELARIVLLAWLVLVAAGELAPDTLGAEVAGADELVDVGNSVLRCWLDVSLANGTVDADSEEGNLRVSAVPLSGSYAKSGSSKACGLFRSTSEELLSEVRKEKSSFSLRILRCCGCP